LTRSWAVRSRTGAVEFASSAARSGLAKKAWNMWVGDLGKGTGIDEVLAGFDVIVYCASAVRAILKPHEISSTQARHLRARLI